MTNPAIREVPLFHSRLGNVYKSGVCPRKRGGNKVRSSGEKRAYGPGQSWYLSCQMLSASVPGNQCFHITTCWHAGPSTQGLVLSLGMT